MKKILFYVDALYGGGAERVASVLAGIFAGAGFEVSFVNNRAVEKGEYPLAQGVRRFVLDAGLDSSWVRRNRGRIARFRRILKEVRPDVAVSFGASCNYRLVVSAVGLPVRTVISVRNDPVREYAGFKGYLFARWLLPLADGCVFQTADARAWFHRRLQRKSEVIYNVVDERFYRVERSGAGRDIVTCGRLTGQKNHMCLIRAFARIADRFPGERLIIYGEGELEESLQKQIDSMGLGGRVLLAGRKDDIPGVLREAEIFALSSDYEGMPNALMEAMASGVACVATDCPCGGPRELFGGDSDMLVPPDDDVRLAEALLRLLEDSAARDTWASHLQARARQFKPDEVFNRWRDYLTRIAG